MKKFPNLKAVWLNGNPVVENCANVCNFDTIGNSFQELEMLNGQFTNKAGEWAMKYLTGKESLDKITYLDARGKNLLTISNLDFLDNMKILKTLDISDNMNMYKSKEMLQAEM